MLSRKDLLLVSHLRQNCRERLTKMSRTTHIPVSTIYDRIKVYESGVIKKHTCLLDFAKLGFDTRATIMFRTGREHREALAEYLQRHHSVNTVHKINNGFDFMAEAMFRQMKELEDFMEKLEAKFPLAERQVFFIIDEIKKEGFMSDPQTVEIAAL